MIKSTWDYQILVFIQVMLVLLGTPLFMLIDSPWVATYFSYGQTTANVLMIAVYCWILWVANKKLHLLVILMTISSFFAEVFGSLILGLYQYRLHNIPLYIPMGHAVIYACIYHLANNPLIWRHQKIITEYLQRLAFVIVCISLCLLKDVFGSLGYLLFLYILVSRQKKLFYVGMFMIVYYVELFGTIFSTWAWYGVIGNHPHLPSIGFTPSGAAGVYILIDLNCNSIYYYRLQALRLLCSANRQLLSLRKQFEP